MKQGMPTPIHTVKKAHDTPLSSNKCSASVSMFVFEGNEIKTLTNATQYKLYIGFYFRMHVDYTT